MNIRQKYVYSDVTSGEFIYSLKFDAEKYTEKQVREEVQEFLNWDESEETFGIVREGNTFKLYATNES